MAEESGRKEDQSANFFDNNNAEAAKARERMASDCLEDLIKWLKEGGNVGIHGEQPSSCPVPTISCQGLTAEDLPLRILQTRRIRLARAEKRSKRGSSASRASSSSLSNPSAPTRP